jgi:hypothetical protein
VNDEDTAPLSDVSGRITHILFALPGYDPTFAQPLLSSFREIREALGPNVRCSVVHRPDQAELVQEHLGATASLDGIAWDAGFVLRLGHTHSTVDGSTLRITRLALPDFTSWIQDAFLVAGNSDRILASSHVRRQHGGWDDEVPYRVADHLCWRYEQLSCAFEAGNVLVDDECVVIGVDVRANASPQQWDALQSVLTRGGRRLVVIGPTPQPVFHLDLYVTLAGLDHASGKPIAVVGSVRRARELIGQRADLGVDQGLDATAAELEQAGYLVRRLPLLPFTSDLAPGGAWYSYNNCLVERYGKSETECRRVIVPAYGSGNAADLDTLDAEAARVWSSLGFGVRLVRGAFAHLAPLGGSVRGMTKVLRRVSREMQSGSVAVRRHGTAQ